MTASNFMTYVIKLEAFSLSKLNYSIGYWPAKKGLNLIYIFFAIKDYHSSEEDDEVLLAEALFDHVTSDSEELSFLAGDVIEVFDTSFQHWWWGELQPRDGETNDASQAADTKCEGGQTQSGLTRSRSLRHQLSVTAGRAASGWFPAAFVRVSRLENVLHRLSVENFCQTIFAVACESW